MAPFQLPAITRALCCKGTFRVITSSAYSYVGFPLGGQSSLVFSVICWNSWCSFSMILSSKQGPAAGAFQVNVMPPWVTIKQTHLAGGLTDLKKVGQLTTNSYWVSWAGGNLTLGAGNISNSKTAASVTLAKASPTTVTYVGFSSNDRTPVTIMLNVVGLCFFLSCTCTPSGLAGTEHRALNE